MPKILHGKFNVDFLIILYVYSAKFQVIEKRFKIGISEDSKRKNICTNEVRKPFLRIGFSLRADFVINIDEIRNRTY